MGRIYRCENERGIQVAAIAWERHRDRRHKVHSLLGPETAGTCLGEGGGRTSGKRHI